MEVVLIVHTESTNTSAMQAIALFAALLHTVLVHTVRLESICTEAMGKNVNTAAQPLRVHAHIVHMENTSGSFYTSPCD